MRIKTFGFVVIAATLFGAAPGMAYPGAPFPYLTSHTHCTWTVGNWLGVYGIWFEPGNCTFDTGDLAYFANSRLVLQPQDGNLVIYAIDSGRAAWGAGAKVRTGVHMSFESDGNLVIWAPDGASWWTGTDVRCNRTEIGEHKYLALQSDGNMVIYCWKGNDTYALWATNTQMH